MYYIQEKSRKSENLIVSIQNNRYGSSLAIKLFYDEIIFNELEYLFESNRSFTTWIESVLQYCSKLSLSNQFLSYKKAELFDLIQKNNTDFEFYGKNGFQDIEHYERLSFQKVRDLSSRVIEQKYEKHISNYSAILERILINVQNPLGKFISYSTTKEIDDFYLKLGYFHLVTQMGYDDFDESDIFGGIPYKKYIDFIQDISGIALKHIDYCTALLHKNHRVNPNNILSYIWYQKKTVNDFAHFYAIDELEMEQILSCLTLNKDNYIYHLGEFAAGVPPYCKISNQQIVRSVSGCLTNAVPFLKKELKRKFSSDYFKAVNNRESRFRHELYLFFEGDRFVKINKEINLNVDGIRTDIDAVIFDRKTKTLGLFQLKWQDSFSTSMQERFSRISNLYPKAIEWLSKIEAWVKNHNSAFILNALQINREHINENYIGDIYLFVIGRNHIHFSGQKLDNRAAWGSWYQLYSSAATIKTLFDDPIREMYVKLKFDEPKAKIERDGLIVHPDNYEMKFAQYKVSYKNKH